MNTAMRALAVLQIYRRYLGNSLILTDTRNPDTTSSLPCAQLLSHLQRILDHPLFNISFYVAPHGCSKEVPFWDLLGNYKHKKLRGGGWMFGEIAANAGSGKSMRCSGVLELAVQGSPA